MHNALLNRRRRGRGSIAAWANLPGGSAVHAWDFLTDQARWNSARAGALSNTPGWTFTRASTGYAQTSAGLLVPFASGELRRTDKGVLIEGARTNLCLQSQTFDNATWTKTRSSISANAIAAPDGTTTADKLVEDSSSGTHPCEQAITIANTTAYTASVYLKAGERTWARLLFFDGSASFIAYLNLATGAIGTTSGALTSVVQTLAGGWYRISITATSTNTSAIFRVDPASADNTNSYQGDGASGIYLWNAQLEASSFPSSPIVTTTASATRAADSLSVTGVTGLDYPLSLFAEFERAVDTGGNEFLLHVDNASANERAALRVNSSDQLSSITVAGGVQQSGEAVTGALALATTYKGALRVATNDIKSARGGTLSSGDTSATNPSAPSVIRFGSDNAPANQPFGYLRRAAIFPRALSDAELQAVTT